MTTMKAIEQPTSGICLKTLGELHSLLGQRIRGQDHVLDRLADAVERRESKVVPQRGARGAFIFAGPTGVGKTLLATTVAETLFGAGRLVRIDCSELKTKESYQSLFGNRSGDAGRIGQAFAQVSSGVWHFDEIEKAHPELVHLFLQGVDAARLTLANGQTLDCRGIYFILTTNLGSAEILGRAHLPFTALEKHVTRAVQKWLRPELRGRFSRPFVFRPLDREAQREIAELYLEEIRAWNRAQGREIEFDPAVITFLICRGYSRELGARPMLQVIEELVGNPLKNDLIPGGAGSGRLVVCGDGLKLVR
jgi:ATP-dependent Clp protease ATP-binding subunit ClpB